MTPRQAPRKAYGPTAFPHTGATERGHQTVRAGRYVAGIRVLLRPQHIHHATRHPRGMNYFLRCADEDD